MTITELRAQLAQYPDEMPVFALDGVEVLDIDAVSTLTDELRCHQEVGTDMATEALLILRMQPTSAYVSLSHFAPWGRTAEE
jgi:hypothetical protein